MAGRHGGTGTKPRGGPTRNGVITLEGWLAKHIDRSAWLYTDESGDYVVSLEDENNYAYTSHDFRLGEAIKDCLRKYKDQTRKHIQ